MADCARRRLCVLVFLFTATGLSHSDTNAKYYQLQGIDVPGLSIRDLAIRGVRVSSQSSPANAEQVALDFSGALTISCSGSSQPCISGATSDRSKPAHIAGVFVWSGQRLIGIRVSSLQISLDDPKFGSKVVAGSLQVSKDMPAVLTIEKAVLFDGSHPSGTLHIVIGRGSVRSAPVQISDLSVVTDLTANKLGFDLALETGIATLTSGLLNTGPSSTVTVAVSNPISKLFPHLVLQAGTASIQGLEIDIVHSITSVHSLYVDKPSIVSSEVPNLKVVGTSGLIATDIRSKAELSQAGVSSPSATASVMRVLAEPSEVADRLNQQWINDPDVLLPTNDSSVHFIQLSSLSSLYSALAEADREPSKIYRIYLSAPSDVVTQTKVETVPVTGKTDYPKVCLIFDSWVARAAASAAATYLVNLVVPGSLVFKPAYSAMLTASTQLGMRFGMPAFYSVWGASGLLKIAAGDQIGSFITNSAKQYCEILLGHGRNTTVVDLPAPKQGPGATHEQQMISRYDAYRKACHAAGVPSNAETASAEYRYLKAESLARAQYNRLLELTKTTWANKQAEQIAQLKSAEAAYAQSITARNAEVKRSNVAVSNEVGKQIQAEDARRSAIQSTPAVTVPVSGSGDPQKIKTYILQVPNGQR